jgi:hypothetical protein
MIIDERGLELLCLLLDIQKKIDMKWFLQTVRNTIQTNESLGDIQKKKC